MIPVIIILIIVLFLILPIGISVCYNEEGVKLNAVAGLIQLTVYPRKKKADKNQKEKKKQKKKKEKTSTADSKKKAKKEKTSGSENKGGKIALFKNLLPIGVSFLNCFRHKLVINTLFISLSIGGLNDDAASAAILYGRAWSAIGALVPFLERTFKLKNRDFHASIDFLSQETLILAEAKITIRIYEIIWLGVYHGIKASAVLLKYRKAKKGGINRGTSN